MSHFNVLVFTTEDSLGLDELLEPYNEENIRAPYIEYTRQEAIDYVRNHHPEFQDKTDRECWKYMAEDCITDKKGNIYTTANPDAHWDWWVEGGRFSNMLKLKDSGERVNSAKIKDIDFSPDPEEYKEALRFWDIVVEHVPLEEGEKQPFSIYKEEYYREFYGTRENFAKRQTQFSTFAVLDSNGIWYECGSMGWFGCSDETPEEAQKWYDNYFKNFIEDEDGETVITIVDCHI